MRAARGTSPLMSYVVRPLEHRAERAARRRTARACRRARRSRCSRSRRAALPEELLRPLRRPRPDVRRADEAERAREDRLLPGVERREDEGRRAPARDGVELVLAEIVSTRAIEYAASARVAGCASWSSSCSCVLQVVEAEAEHARDRLGAEPRLRREPGAHGREPERARLGPQPTIGDELRVELAHRDGAVEVGRTRSRPRRASRARSRARRRSAGRPAGTRSTLGAMQARARRPPRSAAPPTSGQAAAARPRCAVAARNAKASRRAIRRM